MIATVITVIVANLSTSLLYRDMLNQVHLSAYHKSLISRRRDFVDAHRVVYSAERQRRWEQPLRWRLTSAVELQCR